ncbi:MAG: hypothetical protein KAR23_04775, partial [Candidatus Aenigmarchaeota archaeon]|nr:hypothetical protein [Candidatus Aenigmarchaeota archaeon]
NVYISNLSAPSQDGWKLSGAITVYESLIKINNCYFSNNREGDDMLDLVRTDYNITNSIFENILFDAIDDDFGKGTITQSSFVNIGNDALDFSGSVTNLSKIYINGTGDKGVSAGENSKIYIDHIEIENSQIAIASKDLSVIELDYVDIDSADIGLAAYQKKPEFGPSEIKVKNIYLINVTKERFIETASTLWIDDKMISGSEADAYGRLYYE